MRFLFDLVEQGLTKRDLFKPMLGEFVREHRRHGLKHDDIVVWHGTLDNVLRLILNVINPIAQNITTVYREYFHDVLEPHMSQTLEVALKVFFEAVSAAFVVES